MAKKSRQQKEKAMKLELEARGYRFVAIPGDRFIWCDAGYSQFHTVIDGKEACFSFPHDSRGSDESRIAILERMGSRWECRHLVFKRRLGVVVREIYEGKHQ